MAAAKGNQYAAKGRRFASIIAKRLDELKAWEKIADALVCKAMDGDMQAIKEIADRIDGKAKESIDISNEDGSMANRTIDEKALSKEVLIALARAVKSDE